MTAQLLQIEKNARRQTAPAIIESVHRLEPEFRAQQNLSRIGQRHEYVFPEIRAAHDRNRILKIVVIEEIQEIAANFQRPIPVKLETLHQAQIRIGVSRTSEGVSPQCSSNGHGILEKSDCSRRRIGDVRSCYDTGPIQRNDKRPKVSTDWVRSHNPSGI